MQVTMTKIKFFFQVHAHFVKMKFIKVCSSLFRLNPIFHLCIHFIFLVEIPENLNLSLSDGLQ
jgi:hypothetical protein